MGHPLADGRSLAQHLIVAGWPGIREETSPALSALAVPEVVPPTPIVPVTASTAGGSQALVDNLVEALVEILGVERREVEAGRPFAELGVDSLMAVDLVDRINRGLDIVLRTTVLFDHPSVEALAAYIESHHPEAMPAPAPEPAPALVAPVPATPVPATPVPATPKPATPKPAAPKPAAPAYEATRVPASASVIREPRKVVISRPGTVADLELAPADLNPPGPGEVQIVVRAFSLNFGDYLCALGLYPTMPPYPFTPGFEVSGTVAAVGEGVHRVKVGQEVIGVLGEAMGGHSAVVTTPEPLVVPKPDTVSHEEACGFPVVFLTAHHIFRLADLQPGEKILIQTAAGGVGLVAVQMALRAGAEVFTTASTAEKLEHLRRMGVHHPINYHVEDFAEAVQRLTGGGGVDVVINTLAGEAIQQGLDLLAPHGRYFEIAMTALKSASSIDLSRLVDNQSFHSIDLRKMMLRRTRAGGELEEMARVLAAGEILPTVARVFDFEDFREAYACLEQRGNIGKVVVRVTPQSPRGSIEQVTSRSESLPQASMEAPGEQPIAVIGMAGRFPGARDLDELWTNLEEGRFSITEIPRERWEVEGFYSDDRRELDKSYCRWGGFLRDIHRFDPLFFQMSGRDAELTDPHQRLFLETAWNALEDAGKAHEGIAARRVGVYVGVGSGGEYARLLRRGGFTAGGQGFWGNDPSVLASRIAYLLNLKGPSVAVNTACSSSLVALHMACQSLRSGENEMALAGGVYLSLSPDLFVLASNAEMLSPDGKCMAFDDRANGFVPGEGVGAVVLKPLDAALRDGDPIHGVLLATGTNQDGRTNGITAPSAASQAALERSLYEGHGIEPTSLDLIEAHGTGTRLGDPIEMEALHEVFKPHGPSPGSIAIGSIKSNLGHAAAAAGIAGLFKVLLALRQRRLPPSLHFEQPNRHIDFSTSPFYVNTELRPWPEAHGPRRGAVSSFGMSGTNAHVIVQEAPARPSPAPRSWHLLALSGATPEVLDARLTEFDRFLESHPELHLEDVAYTLARGRRHYGVRCVLAVEGREALRTTVEELRLQGASPRYADSQAGLQVPGLPEDLRRTAQRYLEERAYRLEDVYPEGSGRLCSLPTQPLERASYWIPDEDPTANSGLERLPSNGVAERFRRRLEPGEPLVDDHRVQGQRLLPGVASFELALVAARQLRPDAAFDLAKIAWLRPVEVEREARIIELTLEPLGDGFRFTLHPPDAPGQAFSKGRLVPRSAVRDEVLSPAQIRQRCQITRSHVEHYAVYGALGIRYGKAFQAVSRLWIGDGELLAQLDLPFDLRGELSPNHPPPQPAGWRPSNPYRLQQGRRFRRDGAALRPRSCRDPGPPHPTSFRPHSPHRQQQLRPHSDGSRGSSGGNPAGRRHTQTPRQTRYLAPCGVVVQTRYLAPYGIPCGILATH